MQSIEHITGVSSLLVSPNTSTNVKPVVKPICDNNYSSNQQINTLCMCDTIKSWKRIGNSTMYKCS